MWEEHYNSLKALLLLATSCEARQIKEHKRTNMDNPTVLNLQFVFIKKGNKIK
jgi:hypothetical protein